MPTAYEALVQAWRTVQDGTPRYICEGDEALLGHGAGRDHVHHRASYSEFIEDADFGKVPGALFHTGLVPVPYTGNLERARVFILMANPGFGLHDYHAESHFPEFKRAAFDALHQRNRDWEFPMIYLDPKFLWHGGGAYWSNKFSEILQAYEGSYVGGLRALSQGIAVLEEIPYHSKFTGFHGPTIKRLRTPSLVRSFVQDVLVPRARRGEITILDVRGNWGLMPDENIVIYAGKNNVERRAAHFTLSSLGGRKIVERLCLPLRADKPRSTARGKRSEKRGE